MAAIPHAQQSPAAAEAGAAVDENHARLERATAELDAPFACVDLAALWWNASDLLRRAAGKPIRLAPCTRTSPDWRSTSSTRRMRSSPSRCPSVATTSLNECPLPDTRTVRPARRARCRAAAMSAVLAGSSSAAGTQCWSPAQFRHAMTPL